MTKKKKARGCAQGNSCLGFTLGTVSSYKYIYKFIYNTKI